MGDEVDELQIELGPSLWVKTPGEHWWHQRERGRGSLLSTSQAVDLALDEIERLQGLTAGLTDALWNWWGDGSYADPDHDEHADWCGFDNVPDNCICGRSLFPEEDKTNE